MAKQNHTRTKRDPLVAVRVPEELRSAMKAKAKSRDRTFSAEVRQAMRAHVESEERAAA